MMRIDELEDLDPADPDEAQVAIDQAISAVQHIQVQARIEANRDLIERTAASPKAIRLAKRP